MRSAFVQSPAPVVPCPPGLWQARSLTASSGKKISIIGCFFLAFSSSFAQDSLKPIYDSTIHPQISEMLQGNLVSFASPPPNKKKIWFIAGINIVGYGGSLIILNNTWYKNYAHTSFHTFNDSKEWLQVDKVGHGWTAYNAGRVSAAMWQWAGLPQKKSALIGGLSGVTYLTAIEFLDGHSSKWGWSWSDMAANIVGSGFFISQELLWKEQRIQYKFSFHHKDYGEPVLNARADDLFGKVWYERMLKDYNAQTYWLSANIKSFFPQTHLPRWFNISVGYGADGMFGGFENKWTDKQGDIHDRSDIRRIRRFLIAPDADLTKIKTHSKLLHTIFFALNMIKLPTPAVELNSQGTFKLHAVSF